jgi:hypothetical protein
MGEFLLGAVALVLLILLLRAFVGASPTTLAKGLRYAGAGVLAAIAAGLFFLDRPAVAAFLASAAWGIFTGGHVVPGAWRWPHVGRWGRSASSGGQTSSVRTSWLEMELDHDSGDMRGTVLKGKYAGRRLDDLDKAALIALHAEADDPESRRLLEAWLDRTIGPDWRGDFEPRPPERATTGMTRAEALKVLGLSEGATEEDIRAAHRRLMLQNHPDRGGSDYLASKINEAKDLLLGE